MNFVHLPTDGRRQAWRRRLDGPDDQLTRRPLTSRSLLSPAALSSANFDEFADRWPSRRPHTNQPTFLRHRVDGLRAAARSHSRHGGPRVTLLSTGLISSLAGVFNAAASSPRQSLSLRRPLYTPPPPPLMYLPLARIYFRRRPARSPHVRSELCRISRLRSTHARCAIDR